MADDEKKSVNPRLMKPNERAETWQALALSPLGKRAIEDLYEVLGARRTVFVADPQQNAYRQGRQSVAFDIAEMIRGQSNGQRSSNDNDNDE